MTRPCYLVIDREYSGSVSTRKLVIETAKFNVITAYSSVEAVETLKKFPTVNGVVLDTGLEDMPCSELVSALKRVRSDVPVIVVSTPRGAPCANGDYHLDSFAPRELLNLLQKIEPEQTALIAKRDRELLDRGEG